MTFVTLGIDGAFPAPHDPDSIHRDLSGGWLRAATFGAMDGLVSNTALIAGVAAGVGAEAVVVAGLAGLLAGAFSMAVGEYTSITIANEQIDAEVAIERRAFREHPEAEEAQLTDLLVGIGVNRATAAKAAQEIHRSENTAVNVHMTLATGVNPREKPSPWVAALSSFLMFATGAAIPLIPYLLGYDLLWVGLVCAGVGQLISGVVGARFTGRSIWWAALRQLLLGSVAVAVTYYMGGLLGRLF